MSITLIALGATAIASTSALIYDWISDRNKKPTVVINTETAVTGEVEQSRQRSMLIAGGMILIGVYVYFKYIKKRR